MPHKLHRLSHDSMLLMCRVIIAPASAESYMLWLLSNRSALRGVATCLEGTRTGDCLGSFDRCERAVHKGSPLIYLLEVKI